MLQRGASYGLFYYVISPTIEKEKKTWNDFEVGTKHKLDQ